MICLSIRETNLNDFLKSIKKAEKLRKVYPDILLELRLELSNLSDKESYILFSSTSIPLIVSTGKSTRHLISKAIDAGIKYVDMDFYANPKSFDLLDYRIAAKKVKRVISYVNYVETPTLSELKNIYKEAVSRGADIVRIITRSKSISDSKRLMYLYRYQNFKTIKKVPLIAFTIGFNTDLTALASFTLGAPYINICLKKKSRIFENQLTLSDFESYKEKNVLNRKIEGSVELPTSKAIAHRAILSSMLAKGESFFGKIQASRDIDFLLTFVEQMGAKVEIEDKNLTIWGITKKNKIEEHVDDVKLPAAFANVISCVNTKTLYIGESGLLLYFAMPLVAQLIPKIQLSGEGALMHRSIHDAQMVLEDLDVSCVMSEDCTLPVLIEGPIASGEITISARSGAPLISGLLMALPLGKKNTILRVTNVKHISPYVLMTIDIVSKFGVNISYSFDGDDIVFSVPAKQKYSPVDMRIEGDWGAAMNFAVAAAIFGSVNLINVNSKSTQPDREILNVLSDAGASVIYLPNDTINVSVGPLSGFIYDLSDKPFLLPILIVLAAFCEGTSVIKGYDNLLSVNEERTKLVISEFTKMGVKMQVIDNTLEIYGQAYIRRLMESNLLKGGNYTSLSDHRVSMALKIASLACKGKFTIDNIDCVNKSFPNFNEVLNSLVK